MTLFSLLFLHHSSYVCVLICDVPPKAVRSEGCSSLIFGPELDDARMPNSGNVDTNPIALHEALINVAVLGAAPEAMQDTIILEPGRRDLHYWQDLWRYRELFMVLAWRDLSVRYKQTIIGVLWALIRPFLTMLIFTTIFGRIANLPSDGTVPYALMVFGGMLPWTFFSTGLAEASNSLINNANLISKVYFPRLLVPAATIAVAFVDFLISFCILIVLMAWYQVCAGLANGVFAGLCASWVFRYPGSRSLDHRA